MRPSKNIVFIACTLYAFVSFIYYLFSLEKMFDCSFCFCPSVYQWSLKMFCLTFNVFHWCTGWRSFKYFRSVISDEKYWAGFKVLQMKLFSEKELANKDLFFRGNHKWKSFMKGFSICSFSAENSLFRHFWLLSRHLENVRQMHRTCKIAIPQINLNRANVAKISTQICKNRGAFQSKVN